MIAGDFKHLWNFPNCIGALDGKHINLKCPPNSGSYYFNYKGYFSIILLTLVDANYMFRYVDIGCNGRVSDGGVYRNSTLSSSLSENSVNIPGDNKLPGYLVPLPYVKVADDAFPLPRFMMKPFPRRGLSNEKRIFNYRLSRACRVVENAFGILANRFRVLLTIIILSPEVVEKIVLASCTLQFFDS